MNIKYKKLINFNIEIIYFSFLIPMKIINKIIHNSYNYNLFKDNLLLSLYLFSLNKKTKNTLFQSY